jgi:hypothetical protein
MNDLLYKIESISLDDDVDWNKIDDIFKDYRDVIKLIDYFITNLSKNHSVPGDIYNKLLGIGHWSRKHQTITQKQIRYVVLSLASYWNDIDLFKETI